MRIIGAVSAPGRVRVRHGARRETGVERALSGDYSLVVLDVMRPRLNGFDALNSIRSKSTVPVMMLTARGDDVDKIVGLEIGADDYLQRPFNPRELIARIRAVRAHGGTVTASNAPSGGLLVEIELPISSGR